MNPQIQLYSIDTEASGRFPGRYAMLSHGACVIGRQHDPTYQHYVELQPTSRQFEPEALKVCTPKFETLAPYRAHPLIDVTSPAFSGEYVLTLMSHAWSPQAAMRSFEDWVEKTREGKKPVFFASPAGFDWAFSSFYLGNYGSGTNPFGYNPHHIGDLYRGLSGNFFARWQDLDPAEIAQNHTHHALDDAVVQADLFERFVPRLMPW